MKLKNGIDKMTDYVNWKNIQYVQNFHCIFYTKVIKLSWLYVTMHKKTQ
jgi:hypothetical protein